MEAAGFVLAMDFGGTKMALATADLSGRVIEERRLPTRADRGADQAIARALDVARTLVESAAAHHGDGPAAVGVSSMGNTYDDHVEMAPNVVGWSELALPERLRGALRTNDIRIENDVKAAARAEVKWGGLAGVDVGVFVNIGTGFAVAPVIGRRVLHGAHGAAGEIGYNMRSPGEDLAPGAGRRPLEEFIGGHGVATRVRQRFGPRASVPQVFASATAGDAEARSFVDEFVGEIAFHVTNLVIALDPEVVIFGGGFTASMDLILPGVRARTDRFAPFPPRLGLARFAQDGALRGAIALAIDPA